MLLLESFCSAVQSWMYLSNAIKPAQTFRHCLWFIAIGEKTGRKLVETLQASVNED